MSMTIELTPEDQKLVEEKLRSGAFRNVGELIHRALVSLPVEPAPARSTLPKKSLIDVLSQPPFAGSELDLERLKDYPKPIDL
jgi:hypothetical protein